MKKYLYILLGLVVVVITLIYLSARNAKESPTTESTNVAAELQIKTNPTTINPNIPLKVPRPTPVAETNEPTVEMTNALTAMNLEQWTSAIKSLKPLAGFTTEQHWLAEQHERTNGIPIVLSLGDKTIQYKAVLISIEAENGTGDIMATEMQTANMNIDETRELGLQLCSMLNLNPNDFLAWCNKVGNRWLDTPLFGAKYFRDPNTNMIFTFQILRGYNDQKPWLINFIIERPN